MASADPKRIDCDSAPAPLPRFRFAVQPEAAGAYSVRLKPTTNRR
jgi:hypothetical protein